MHRLFSVAARGGLSAARIAGALVLACAACVLCPALAYAEGHRSYAYAVVVGDDLGGPGQETLRFAEDDARRVAQVLREIGHYDAADVHVLLRPNVAQLLAAVDDVSAQLRASADRGAEAEVFFYFSGHARASALNLGTEELSLASLRDRLRALSSSLTIVVLDACQSGSFSRVKGAEPAADFSYNSVSRLTQKGLAVMASSTSGELSQESDELQGSYFTHHLVTGLRGAGDADGDGRVSLDEAYRYAYRRTLASTARTNVGEQHVTLETDLAGQGDLPVTFPAEAKAQLELPAALDARVLVQHRSSGAVIAEVQKAPGAPVRLAFVAGSYDAVVRQNGAITECHFALADDRVTEFDPTACRRVVPDRASTKGDATETARPMLEIDRWTIEAAIGGMSHVDDAYTARLREFGYGQSGDLFHVRAWRATLGASRTLAPHLAGVLQLTTLASDAYERFVDVDRVSLRAYGGAIALRAFTEVAGRWLGVYAQAGIGASLGIVDFRTQQSGVPPTSTETYWSYLLSGDIGVTAKLSRHFSLFVQAGYDRAPAIQNRIGDGHDSGGVSAMLGAHFRLGEGQ